MEYQFIQEPLMLQETAAMLFKFVNGISFKELLVRKKFIMSNEVTASVTRRMEGLQRIMEDICGNLDPQEPRLQRFFAKAPVENADLYLAQLMTMSFCRIHYPGLRENAAEICQFWRESQESGAWLDPQSWHTLLLTEEPGKPGDLFEQICRLSYPPEFQLKLYGALREFDKTMEELVELMEPVARELETRFRQESWLQQETVEYWQGVFQKTSPKEVAKEILGYDSVPGNPGKTYVVPMYMNSSFVAFGEDQQGQERFNLLILGSGATAGSRLQQQSSVLDGLSAALKAIGDRKRLEILCRLSKGRSYCHELADAMGIDSGNMSRHLALLNSYGLLRQEREPMINYYETNKEALHELLQLVESTIAL